MSSVNGTDHDTTLRLAATREKSTIGLDLLADGERARPLAPQYAYPYLEIESSSLSSLLVTAHRPFDAAAESFRSLRTHLMLRWFKTWCKAITVAASRRREGASTIAANLAVSFAQLGQRTLLIDANLRTPRQHELFGLANAGGLSQVLSGRCAAHDALLHVAPFEHLSVLCAGPTPPNPQELLAREAFSYLLDTARSGFDVVIVDTAPLLDYTDGLVVSALTGGCLLVARRDSTRLEDIADLKRQVLPTGATLVGAVLND